MNNSTTGVNNFNYKISKFFLENNRLTILCLFLLVLLGLFATLNLKTVGFPNPEIKFAQIITIFPGASSESVVKEVTQPLEGAIKNVDGIKTFTSQSNNSFSFIGITIDEAANADSVRSKMDSAIRSVTLPAGAEAPKISTPQISGPDFIFVITGENYSKMSELYKNVNKDLLELSDTSFVTPIIDFGPKVIVKVNDSKLKELGISIDIIKAQLKSIGETLPVVSDASLENQSKTLVTKLSGQNFEDIKNIGIPTATGIINLGDISQINLDYQFENNSISSFAYNQNNIGVVKPAVTFTVKAIKGADLSKYTQTVYDKLNKYNNDEFSFIKTNESISIDNKTKLIETYAQNDANQEQTSEVVRGLIGGPLKDVDNSLKYFGLILGAVQLIFLVMIAFVSWRAAVVAALSIPLSLIFANIFLYFTGHDLNTLTLFSLVLVLGLVVDPTLVVLEAIQRKIDAGFRGKAAALEAIKDVGNGLFLAIVANIIVFLPFALISGILGQIFSYIPLTVIPALIGSYIVPLIFLAWIGGLILKPNKKSKGSEEENLWSAAKWLVKTNYKILNSSIWLRLGIIALAIIISFSVAGFYLGSGAIKSVQFASSDDSNFMILSGSFLTTVSKEDRERTTSEILQMITETKGVKNIFLESSAVDYFINLIPKKDRPDLKATKIAEIINKNLDDNFNNKFFDIKADVIQTGPPTSSYQVSIGVKTDDLVLLEKTSKDVNKTLNNICMTDRTIEIAIDCPKGKRIVTKVDDGFTNKENKVIEVLLDRNKLLQQQLTIPNIPLTAIVNSQLKEIFTLQGNDKDEGKITINNEEISILLDKTSPNPKSIEEIKNLNIFSPATGKSIRLSDIAIIREVTAKSSITRVKGQTLNNVQARLEKGSDDQGTAAMVTNAVLDYYHNNDGTKTKELGLTKDSIEQYSEGDTASFIKSFQELFSALILAIILIYVILALFFKSFSLPIVILFTIPLTFIGVFPALSTFTGGQFGFLEIIGLIILTGLVVNVAIFLIDAAKQKVSHEGWDQKRAISYASGIRLRPVLLTKFTAIASLLPLALFSEFYRSIAVVIMFGLLTSGFTSLFTTPILYIFFKWVSIEFQLLKWWGKILFFPLFPFYLIALAIRDKNKRLI